MRRQISWLVVATTSTVVVAFVIPLCLLVRTLAADRAMADAEQEARNISVLVASLDDAHLATVVADVNARGTATTQVLTAGGKQIGSGAPMASDPDVQRARQGTAYKKVGGDGGKVVLPVVRPEGTAVVRSTVTTADLRNGVVQAWLLIVGVALLLLALALLIAARIGQRISEPLREVAGTAHRLRAGELMARAEVRGTEETRELAGALNGLAERIRELLAHERAAVGDLSHRLRTPVTALRLDAESVQDPQLATRLQEHIAVLQRTIDAVVKQARRPVSSELSPTCDVAATLRERIDFWRPLAEDQDRPMDVLVLADDLLVPLAKEDLVDVVDVLVDNIFAHTPEGTPLRVELGRDDVAGQAVLVVLDGGPGISANRGDGSRPGTSGLGLDITSRTVRSGGGSLRVGPGPEGGTLVEIRLPLAPG